MPSFKEGYRVLRFTVLFNPIPFIENDKITNANNHVFSFTTAVLYVDL